MASDSERANVFVWPISDSLGPAINHAACSLCQPEARFNCNRCAEPPKRKSDRDQRHWCSQARQTVTSIAHPFNFHWIACVCVCVCSRAETAPNSNQPNWKSPMDLTGLGCFSSSSSSFALELNKPQARGESESQRAHWSHPSGFEWAAL